MKTKVLFFVLASALLAMMFVGCDNGSSDTEYQDMSIPIANEDIAAGLVLTWTSTDSTGPVLVYGATVKVTPNKSVVDTYTEYTLSTTYGVRAVTSGVMLKATSKVAATTGQTSVETSDDSLITILYDANRVPTTVTAGNTTVMATNITLAPPTVATTVIAPVIGGASATAVNWTNKAGDTLVIAANKITLTPKDGTGVEYKVYKVSGTKVYTSKGVMEFYPEPVNANSLTAGIFGYLVSVNGVAREDGVYMDDAKKAHANLLAELNATTWSNATGDPQKATIIAGGPFVATNFWLQMVFGDNASTVTITSDTAFAGAGAGYGNEKIYTVVSPIHGTATATPTIEFMATTGAGETLETHTIKMTGAATGTATFNNLVLKVIAVDATGKATVGGTFITKT